MQNELIGKTTPPGIAGHTSWKVQEVSGDGGFSVCRIETTGEDFPHEVITVSAADYCTKEHAELFAKVVNNRARYDAVDEMVQLLHELPTSWNSALIETARRAYTTKQCCGPSIGRCGKSTKPARCLRGCGDESL
ncbi:MAG: hypothetical protein AAF862_11835 [Pseudomonadota bacterium]